MTGPTRKLTVIVAGLVCLIVAGTAGAIVRATIFTITPGNYARLSGTGIYCSSLISSTKARSFLCASTSPRQGRYSLVGSYFLVINQAGVTVEHATDVHGHYTHVRSFVNR
jgi:hypothetical protein